MSENQIIMSENQDKFFCLVIWGTSIMPGRQTCHFRASGLKDFPEEVPWTPTLDEALRPDHSRTASYGPEQCLQTDIIH